MPCHRPVSRHARRTRRMPARHMTRCATTNTAIQMHCTANFAPERIGRHLAHQQRRRKIDHRRERRQLDDGTHPPPATAGRRTAHSRAPPPRDRPSCRRCGRARPEPDEPDREVQVEFPPTQRQREQKLRQLRPDDAADRPGRPQPKGRDTDHQWQQEQFCRKIFHHLGEVGIVRPQQPDRQRSGAQAVVDVPDHPHHQQLLAIRKLIRK